MMMGFGVNPSQLTNPSAPKLFIIRCAKNDPTPFLKFLEYINKFIASEREKVPELFEVCNPAVREIAAGVADSLNG